MITKINDKLQWLILLYFYFVNNCDSSHHQAILMTDGLRETASDVSTR